MLSEKINYIFKYLKNELQLNEKNTAVPLEEVKHSLLSSDVSYSATISLIDRIKNIIKSNEIKISNNISAGQKLIAIMHQELIKSFGGENRKDINVSGNMPIFVVCGLQGHGKTTTISKLVHYLIKTKKKQRVMVACCDKTRPAGFDQLKKVSENAGGIVLPMCELDDLVESARNYLEYAKHSNADALIIDTAGRQNINVNLMNEISNICNIVKPNETILVISAIIGQSSKDIVDTFNKYCNITSIFVSMVDSSARLGSVLSLGEEMCSKIIFEGVGEKHTDLQEFNAISAADRVLGKGDIINLVKNIESNISKEESQDISQKIMDGSVNFNDISKIISMFKRLGSFSKIFDMLGFNATKSISLNAMTSENSIKMTSVIINSMTKRERELKDKLCFSRKKRIAKGSGRSLEDINFVMKILDFTKEFKNIIGKNKNISSMLGSIVSKFSN